MFFFFGYGDVVINLKPSPLPKVNIIPLAIKPNPFPLHSIVAVREHKLKGTVVAVVIMFVKVETCEIAVFGDGPFKIFGMSKRKNCGAVDLVSALLKTNDLRFNGDDCLLRIFIKARILVLAQPDTSN